MSDRVTELREGGAATGVDRASIEALDRSLRQIRHSIHAHPETGFEEVRTSRLVADTLRSLAIEVHEGIAKTASSAF